MQKNILNHLGQTLITGPINLQSPSILSGLSPLSSTGQPHLTTLYPGTNDDDDNNDDILILTTNHDDVILIGNGTNGSRDCIETIDIPGGGSGQQPSVQPINNGQQGDHKQHQQQSTTPTSAGQNKKRRISESSKNITNNVQVKLEPGGGMSPEPGHRVCNSVGGTVMVSMEDEYGFDYNTNTEGPPSVYLDSAYQCIRFQIFQQSAWHILCDASLKEL